jgi:short-subunit dehydrogenase
MIVLNLGEIIIETSKTMILSRRSALVTGATKGIGWAIAEKFAAGNIDLVLTSRNSAELQERKNDLKARFPDIEVLTFEADLSKREQVKALSDFVLSSKNKLDILVNNAGVFLSGEILNEKEGVLEETIETNLYSAYHLTRDLIGHIKKSERGYILNMCSIASLAAYPNGGSYTISKFAMLGMSRVLREELKASSVAVSAILPGATWSASWTGSGIPKDRIIDAYNIADVCWQIVNMAPNAVVEEVIIRPQLGDL